MTTSKIKLWLRWLLKRCMDCGKKLDKDNDRGDLCDSCYDDFNGITIEELLK